MLLCTYTSGHVLYMHRAIPEDGGGGAKTLAAINDVILDTVHNGLIP